MRFLAPTLILVSSVLAFTVAYQRLRARFPHWEMRAELTAMLVSWLMLVLVSLALVPVTPPPNSLSNPPSSIHPQLNPYA